MNTVKRLNDFGLAQRLEDYIKARRDDPADSRLPGIALVDPACDPIFRLVRKELIGRVVRAATIFDDFTLLELTREFMLRTLTTATGLDIMCEILVELQVRRSEEIAARRERAKGDADPVSRAA
jgi:hypothetical protein